MDCWNLTVSGGGYEEFGFWERDISGGLIYRSLSENFKAGFHNDDIWKIWTDDSLVFFQSFTNVYKIFNVLQYNSFFKIRKLRKYFIAHYCFASPAQIQGQYGLLTENDSANYTFSTK